MERWKRMITQALLAFVLISVGFALGKHAAKSRSNDTISPNGSGEQVAVYYLHPTFRCDTCNTIEKMTRDLLRNYYSEELAKGYMVWFLEDFQENEVLAEKFEVAANCVVVAILKNGQVTEYVRLDQVWTKIEDPVEFNRYIQEPIQGFLSKLEGA